MDFLKNALQALPYASQNLYGLIAYAITILAWFVIAIKVVRNKHLLKNLEKLPPQDRLPALQIEMRGVNIKEGVKPEQWLNNQTKKYILIGYLLTLLTILLVIIIAFSFKNEEPFSLRIMLHNRNTTFKKDVQGHIAYLKFLKTDYTKVVGKIDENGYVDFNNLSRSIIGEKASVEIEDCIYWTIDTLFNIQTDPLPLPIKRPDFCKDFIIKVYYGETNNVARGVTFYIDNDQKYTTNDDGEAKIEIPVERVNCSYWISINNQGFFLTPSKNTVQNSINIK